MQDRDGYGTRFFASVLQRSHVTVTRAEQKQSAAPRTVRCNTGRIFRLWSGQCISCLFTENNSCCFRSYRFVGRDAPHSPNRTEIVLHRGGVGVIDICSGAWSRSADCPFNRANTKNSRNKCANTKTTASPLRVCRKIPIPSARIHGCGK